MTCGSGRSLALVGAFPFPHPQGSQVYAADQARALQDAGARVRLFTYARGIGADAADLSMTRVPESLSRHSLRSGPNIAKPVADAALLATLVRAGRRERFDAVLAHNAEAACVALAARPWLGCPVIYVAHTLLAEELSSYLDPCSTPSPRLAAWLDRGGGWIDRFLARRADGVLGVSRDAVSRLGQSARGECRYLPPGLAAQPGAPAGPDGFPHPPEESARRALCERFSLPFEGFVLYAGNLDGYQRLSVLDHAARELAPRGVPVVVATHRGSSPGSGSPGSRLSRTPGSRIPPTERRLPSLRIIEVESFEEVRALTFAAAVLALPRARVGGFPIKLLNYLESGRPIVASAGAASELRHGQDAWVLDPETDGAGWAAALGDLIADPARGAELAAGARQRLVQHHRWHELAGSTLELVEAVITARTR